MRGIFTEGPVAAATSVSPGTIGPIATWVKVGNALSYTTFQTAALFKTNTLFSIVAGGVISGIKIKHSTAFAGGAIATCTIEVGIVGTLNKYAAAFDVFQAVSGTAESITGVTDTESGSAATNIVVTARSTVANLSALTAGVVDIWALLSKAA